MLCVHIVLIKEITRRVNLTNTWQAIYTAGIVIPRPVTTATYWHRSLNPKKLIEIGFSSLPAGIPMARHLKAQQLQKESEIALIGNVREMTAKDVSKVTKLLNTELDKYKLRLKLTDKDVAHMILPRENVVYAWVVENPENGQLTDFVSFYSLPSSILKKTAVHSHDKVNVRLSYLILNL
jgi:glycylpeptide N-tetradecanoyltransferase